MPCRIQRLVRRLGTNSGLKAALLLVLISLSCGVTTSNDICNCTPSEPTSADYRHAEKHVPLPNMTPQEITVATILSWPQDATPLPSDRPRTGRELQLFHIAQAYLQSASVIGGDCDIHFEVSQTADKSAPRAIVETPVDSEYCSARRNIQSQLKTHGFLLDANHGGELPTPVVVDILGMAFEDFEHHRGSPQVATVWELHPAIVTVTQ